MVHKILSFGISGIDAYSVYVETDVSRGLPAFDIVGLPDTAIKEAKERVRSAYKNSGFTFPAKRITINLAPANVKKVGSIYDLPILLGLLLSSGELKYNTDGCAFAGELSLMGEVREVNGILPMVMKAKDAGIHSFFIPKSNVAEVIYIDGINIFPVANVKELIDHFTTEDKKIEPIIPQKFKAVQPQDFNIDFSEVMGQLLAKRAVEIAAAGGHNILLIGPPGSGKSMIAKRMTTILPPLSFNESIECTKIYSVAGKLDKSGIIFQRPFRTPHHTISDVALCGGGTNPKPGEISLAHCGILFLDEFAEFSTKAIDSMRAPLEDGKITISRANGSVDYPSNFMLVCAMNPCKCGYLGHPTKQCTCTPSQIYKYSSKISGPMLDRIDLHVEVPSIDYKEISSEDQQEKSEEITGIYKNADLTPELIKKFCVLTDAAKQTLEKNFDKFNLTGRGYNRVLKVARTIADLEESEKINEYHILEALQYRAYDKIVNFSKERSKNFFI